MDIAEILKRVGISRRFIGAFSVRLESVGPICTLSESTRQVAKATQLGIAILHPPPIEINRRTTFVQTPNLSKQSTSAIKRAFEPGSKAPRLIGPDCADTTSAGRRLPSCRPPSEAASGPGCASRTPNCARTDRSRCRSGRPKTCRPRASSPWRRRPKPA